MLFREQQCSDIIDDYLFRGNITVFPERFLIFYLVFDRFVQLVIFLEYDLFFYLFISKTLISRLGIVFLFELCSIIVMLERFIFFYAMQLGAIFNNGVQLLFYLLADLAGGIESLSSFFADALVEVCYTAVRFIVVVRSLCELFQCFNDIIGLFVANVFNSGKE